jgi:hypothetical protein
MAFCVSTCEKCGARFRLRWRLGGRKIDPQQRLRLLCPKCGETFETAAFQLAVFDSGREAFPLEAIVGKESLIRSTKPGSS